MFLKLAKKFTLFIFVFICCQSTIIGQNQTDNMGKEFWFSFLENYTNPVQVSFSISCKTSPNTVNIRVGALNLPFKIFRKDTVISFTNALVSPNANTFINKSINISSIKDISVYALNNSLHSTDIATIVPINNIPYNPVYYINTYRGDKGAGGSNSSEFSIVAIDDSCFINILPTSDATTYGGTLNTFDLKDTLIKRVLRKNEMIWLQASDSQSLAGTKIWNSFGCKRFSVFEGAKCSRVLYEKNCSGCDHLYNQSRSVQLQGYQYTTIPYQNLIKGYVVQIVATENNTSLYIDGNFIKIMNEREVYLLNNLNNSPNCIKADKKISVIQIMKSGICNGNNIGNPSIMTVLPDDQLTSNVQFIAPTTGFLSTAPAEFFLGITCPKQNLRFLTINGKPIDTSSFIVKCNNYVGNIKINAVNSFTLNSAKGFIAYLYASGNDESYATELGGGFELNRAKLTIVPDLAETCDTFNQFTFKANSDSSATYFWKFGDGTTRTGDSVVTKIYNKRGVFNLSLIVNYISSKGCAADTFDKTITIYRRPYFSLGKDTSLCSGDYYTLSPFITPKSKFLWQNNSQYRTFNASNTGIVFLTVTDTNKCTFTDSINLKFINCDTNSIKLPNVFTPGTVDELNDNLEAQFTGYNILEGRIYNRWGVLMYKFTYPQDDYWNGNLHNHVGSPCPSGTYYYIYKFTNTRTNLIKEVNGTVQLIR